MKNTKIDEANSEKPQPDLTQSYQVNDSDKENLPPPALKNPGKTSNSLFKARSKHVKIENIELFKGLTFFLEIFHNGQSQHSFFEKAIIDHGGKVSRRLGKHVTHLVWSDGRTKTLNKALELEDISIISTLWFQETLEEL